jgi:hypothetical protein
VHHQLFKRSRRTALRLQVRTHGLARPKARVVPLRAGKEEKGLAAEVKSTGGSPEAPETPIDEEITVESAQEAPEAPIEEEKAAPAEEPDVVETEVGGEIADAAKDTAEDVKEGMEEKAREAWDKASELKEAGKKRADSTKDITRRDSVARNLTSRRRSTATYSIPTSF